MKINISWLVLLAVKNLKEVQKFKIIFDKFEDDNPFSGDQSLNIKKIMHFIDT